MALSRTGTHGRDRDALLVLRALGLGDFLTGVPALRALRRAFPEHELVLAAPQGLRPLVSLAGAVDRLLDTRGLDGVEWPGVPPAQAVNLHGKGPQSHRVLQRLRPGALVAFGCAAAGHEGPPWRPDEHEVRRWCRLLTESLGIDTDASDLLISRPSEPPPVSRAAVVHPGAAFPSRRWPPERFAAVARGLRERGLDVVVTGGPEERRLAQRVAGLAGLPDRAVLAGRTDLAELAAVVADAELVVCGDTGVAHLATAYATPSVVLFGPVSPASWGPPVGAGEPHTVLWRGEGTGDPWGPDVDPALSAIEVEEVLAAADERLTAGRTTPASA